MNAMSLVRKPFLRLAPLALGLTAVPLMAETIAVIGTGNVGGALGPAFAAQGHDVVYGSREPGRADVQALVARTPGNAGAAPPAEAVVGADIVVLAVPGAAAEDAVLSLGDLSGKIIIDPTNRVAPGEDGYFDHVAETSNGQLVQSLAPDARVVKA
ncbi:MAG: NAD(P)-binding domain-containing protein, partial [Rhodospirillaceae bacterium]|nr:NAD(P)-binding domain-containing protein [Rhodospirillaceae bacterium]